jgi:hypothetical protein
VRQVRELAGWEITGFQGEGIVTGLAQAFNLD